MKPPIFVRPLSDAERESLEAGLRSSQAFTLRRCQILLASARGERPSQIARALGCTSQTVRNTIHAFTERGVAALEEGSHRAHSRHPVFDGEGLEALKALAHQSPRTFGHPTSLWTLDLLAQESVRQQLCRERVSGQTIRRSLLRIDVSWKRAKYWITSPDPGYARKKAGATV
jgi:DNA-binding CsgD family transcriptional regulator